MSFTARIRRAPGGVRLDLSERERELLRWVIHEVVELLDEPEDPAVQRLFPRAHEDDDLERQYRDLAGEQLASGRRRALDTLAQTLGRTMLSPEEADAWLRGLNDARLVFGTRLDVREDFDWDDVGFDHPQAQELALYAYLSSLQAQLVEAL